jgi:hypothetical protein
MQSVLPGCDLFFVTMSEPKEGKLSVQEKLYSVAQVDANKQRFDA